MLQYLSDSRQGIVELDSSTKLNSRILASYLPAFIMLVVATVYNSIESITAIIAPYSKLKRGNVPARSPYITADMTSKIPPHALFLAVRSLDVGYATCILTVFVATFLTVVVSGLYTPVEISGHFTTSVKQADTFTFEGADFSLSDNGAASITSLLEYSDLPYPAWTYDNLAFNKVVASSDNDTSGTVTLQAPAYRTVLNCSVGYDYAISILNQSPDSGSSVAYEPGSLVVQIDAHVPLACQRMPTNDKSVTWTQYYHVPNDTSVVYVGKGTTFQWVANDTYADGTVGPSMVGDGAIVAVSSGGVDVTLADMPSGNYGCPTFGFSIGTATVKRRVLKNGTELLEPEANMTLAMCYQNLELVQTNLTLDLPDLSINPALPPAPEKSTAVLVTNASSGSQIWEWPINNLLAALTNTTSKSLILSPAGGSPALNDIDAFIQTLVQGKSPIPITSMLGPAGIDAFVEASARLYSEYMAQATSANLRITTVAANNNISYPAAVADVPRWRLLQNRTPKIALQVMLAFLAGAAVAIYLIVDVRQILPHNPCSIAGVATLLVDSGVCAREFIPVGVEWASAKKGAEVLGGLRFGMAWVDVPDKGRVFGIHAEGDGGG